VKHRIPDRVVVAGIGTDVGKTLVSAVLCLGLEADYWKPVQCGRVPCTDTEWVRGVTGLPAERFHPEGYCLDMAASPHVAAASEGVRIEGAQLQVPVRGNRLIIEAAGGLMVPLHEDLLFVDQVEVWGLPVILVVHTYLGSINHSLLSLEALRNRGIPLAGIVFNDGGRPESEGIILNAALAPLLGRVPQVAEINHVSLREVFDFHFLVC
jgi:dethiobiotin synthetase